MKILILTITASLLLFPQDSAKPLITEAQAREWGAYAVAQAKGNPDIFQEKFRSLARIVAPSYSADPFYGPAVTIHQSDELRIAVVGPVAMFQLAMSERVRKIESTGDVPWSSGVDVMVSPQQIDAPDIEKIVVQRNGATTLPLVNGLIRSELQTRIGAKRLIQQGGVTYPISAFLLGTEVTVIAIPASGSNIVMVLKDPTLKMIQ